MLLKLSVTSTNILRKTMLERAMRDISQSRIRIRKLFGKQNLNIQTNVREVEHKEAEKDI